MWSWFFVFVPIPIMFVDYLVLFTPIQLLPSEWRYFISLLRCDFVCIGICVIAQVWSCWPLEATDHKIKTPNHFCVSCWGWKSSGCEGAFYRGWLESDKQQSEGGLIFSSSLFPNLYGLIFQGRTPLHIASRKGHGSVVEFLLFKGADVSSRDGLVW